MRAGRRSRAPRPPLLQAAVTVTGEVAAHSVERTRARRARVGQDDSQSAGAEATSRGRHVPPGRAHIVRRGVSRPAGPGPRKPREAQRPAPTGIRAPRQQCGAGVMPRHAGNRAEKLRRVHHRQRTSAFTMLESAVGVKPCNSAGNMRPACPGAETRQCTDQAEPVRDV